MTEDFRQTIAGIPERNASTISYVQIAPAGTTCVEYAHSTPGLVVHCTVGRCSGRHKSNYPHSMRHLLRDHRAYFIACPNLFSPEDCVSASLHL